MLYVTVDDPSIIPEDERTYGPSIIKELSKLDEWVESWTTLRVYREGSAIKCELDPFLPHTVPKEHVLDKYPLVDISACNTIGEFKHRVSEVFVDGRARVLKIARFQFELPSLIRELKAYHALPEYSPAPRLVGYVFEECTDRVVGFLIEFLEGRPADSTDIESCYQALEQLHRYLIHGDLCKYNILITSQGPRFIDFENSILCDSDKWSTTLRDAEKHSLGSKLADTSGVGRPYLKSEQL